MTAHKILIATAIIFFLFFAVVQWRGIAAGHGTPVSAALAGAAAVALAIYFMTLQGQ